MVKMMMASLKKADPENLPKQQMMIMTVGGDDADSITQDMNFGGGELSNWRGVKILKL